MFPFPSFKNPYIQKLTCPLNNCAELPDRHPLPSPLMDTALTIIADIVILVTLPLHCRYLFVMMKKRSNISSLEYSFRATLANIGKVMYSSTSQKILFSRGESSLLHCIHSCPRTSSIRSFLRLLQGSKFIQCNAFEH